MRTLMTGLMAAAFLFAIAGCKEEGAVPTDKPKAEFIQTAEQQMANLDSRIDKAKSEAAGQGDAAEAVIESATEMAEEKLETLRKSMLPALNDAMSSDDIANAKADINRTLVDATSEVERAEKALAESMTDRQRYADSVTGELGAIETRLAEARAEAANVDATVKDRVSAAGESVEEAIDEARKALDRFKDASDSDAGTIQKNIDHLLASAKSTLDDMRKMIDDATQQASAS